jgi:hypothetical protein
MIVQSTWQDATWPTADCIITDPPFSLHTHRGHALGKRTREQRLLPLDFDGIASETATEWGECWGTRATSWVCILTDHVLIPAWETGLRRAGLYVFAPIPCVIKGMTVRLTGDGPSSWSVFMVVARTRAASRWGTLPGAYIVNRERVGMRGAKPLALMQLIVQDYTRRGMTVVDPCAGSGTTLVAAHALGRHVWGCEPNTDRCEHANQRLRKTTPV